MGQAAGLPDLVIRPLGQLRDGVAGEKVRRHPLGGGLLGDGLRAVFAEFHHLTPIVGVRPGAARAIEPPALIGLQQFPRAPEGTHLGQGVLRGRDDGLQSSGHGGRD
jgi:hypothetical protein